MSNPKKSRTIYLVLTLIALFLFVFFLTGCRDFPTPQDILKPEKYSMYYPLSAYVKGDELTLEVLNVKNTSYINVVNIKENLEIKVYPGYEGTVLVVKHWSKKSWGYNADSALIIVRTEKIKILWENAIKESLDDLERKATKPKDIVPEIYLL